jgi:hypothetical protein
MMLLAMLTKRNGTGTYQVVFYKVLKSRSIVVFKSRSEGNHSVNGDRWKQTQSGRVIVLKKS